MRPGWEVPGHVFGLRSVASVTDHAPDFDEPRRGSRSWYEGPQDTSGWRHFGRDQVEVWIRKIGHRLVEDGMVRDIEGARAELEHDSFCDPDILRQREIHVEEMRLRPSVPKKLPEANCEASKHGVFTALGLQFNGMPGVVAEARIAVTVVP